MGEEPSPGVRIGAAGPAISRWSRPACARADTLDISILPLSSTTLHILEDPAPDRVAGTPAGFLEQLGGATEIRLSGRDASRYRVAVGLLHGNEPSGLVAIHRWLRAGARPAVDCSLFVMAVEAARLPPGLAHRMPPGGRDLNRCFLGPFDDRDGALAAALLERVRHRPCEALVDMHNNTGHNPPYGVLTAPDRAHLALVSLFSDITCLLGDLRLGALLEVLPAELPAASIECGQAHTRAADDLAARGLRRFLEADDLGLSRPRDAPMKLLDRPIRMCLRPGTRIAFGDQPVAGVDLTLVEHVERHNFQTLAPGTLLGWLEPAAPWPFVARDAAGRDVSRDCFATGDGTLRWRGDLVPIMITTDARVAFADCLCYLMREPAPRDRATGEPAPDELPAGAPRRAREP